MKKRPLPHSSALSPGCSENAMPEGLTERELKTLGSQCEKKKVLSCHKINQVKPHSQAWGSALLNFELKDCKNTGCKEEGLLFSTMGELVTPRRQEFTGRQNPQGRFAEVALYSKEGIVSFRWGCLCWQSSGNN